MACAVSATLPPGHSILETDFETDSGVVRLVDCMPLGDADHDVVRIVEGVRGSVAMQMRLAPKFDYGRLIPASGQIDQGMFAVAGPDAVCLRTPVTLGRDGATASAAFTVAEGDRIPFHLAWYPSHLDRPEPIDPFNMVARTEAWWRAWSGRCTYQGPHAEDVLRSLITLKALTYAPTGAIVAALTTSLPEEIGGERNWDYRFCWLRDGAFTLGPLVHTGYMEEAVAWRDWLLRAIAGAPSQLQLMYGIAGEHRLPELELTWLPGYEASKPVRIGNAASEQFQLDIFGEVMAVLHEAWQAGLPIRDPTRSPGISIRDVVELLEGMWREPDEGIWEVRGQRQHFTYSKVSAWTAVDRAIKYRGRDRSRRTTRPLASPARRDPCATCWPRATTPNETRSSSTTAAKDWTRACCSFQSLASSRRTTHACLGTIDAIQAEICEGPFVWRYSTDEGADGLAGSEGAFLICSFWLVSALARGRARGSGRREP